MKFEIIYIATNGYINYAENFLNSLHNFCPGVKKIVRILTNNNITIDTTEYDGGDIAEIEVIPIFDLLYPFINLHKTSFITQMAPTNADYVFYFDADTVFNDMGDYDWEGNLINKLKEGFFCISLHPFYNLSDDDKWKKINIRTFFTDITVRDESRACSIKRGVYNYVISSFFCARRDVMMNVCNEINGLIKKDLSDKYSYIIPPLSDENYFNKIVSDVQFEGRQDIKVLMGAYILLGNSNNKAVEEAFLTQKNMNNEFKTEKNG